MGATTVERAGVQVEFVDPANAPEHLKQGVLTVAGKSRQGRAERGFSMTLSRLFDPADTAHDVPHGLTDYMIVRTIQHSAAHGAQGVGLNFAVLRETMNDPPPGLRGRVSKMMQEIAARHSQLGSLARFDAKYRPRWVPRYLVRGSNDEVLAQALAVAQVEGRLDFQRPRRAG